MSEPTKPDAPDAPPPTPTEYEFTEKQNETITVVGGGFWLLGVILAVLGIKRFIRCFAGILYLTGQYGKPATWSDVLDAALLGFLLLSFGFSFLNAAASFRAVVETKGHDITHLMTALGYVARTFSVIIIVACVVLVLSLVLLVLQLFGVQ